MASLAPFVDEQYAGLDFAELAAAPVEALAGISPEDAALIKRALGVQTIGDLGRNRHIIAAVSIAALAASAAPAEEDVFAAARQRGEEARAFLLKAEGPPLTASDVSRLLGIPADDVEQWRRNGTIIGLPAGHDGYVYPRWQFDPVKRAVLPGLTDVLGTLRVEDPWMRTAFFLRSNHRLNGARPLDALRAGDVESARRAAVAYGEQGAA